MATTYKSQIMGWDWKRIVEDTRRGAADHVPSGGTALCNEGCDGDGHSSAAYLGTVMSLAPSGKFYMPWTTNQTERDVERDSRWYTALDEVATKHGGWIESGEGDPTDLYFMRYWADADLV